MSIILGIDPGSRILGFGVVSVERNQVRHIEHGVIDVSRYATFSLRLKHLGEQLNQVLETYSPTCIVLEKIFLGKNIDSSFKLGHARGVCLYEAARRQVPIYEYEARVIKKGITGSGAATKEHVRMISLMLLGITSREGIDATDALSMALYHSRVQETRLQFERLKIDPPPDLGEAL